MTSPRKRRPNFEPFWRQQRRGQTPLWQFDLPDSERLAFAPLSMRNYRVLHRLFAHEANPFFRDYYTDTAALRDYAFGQMYYGRFSGKHGVHDWFIRSRRDRRYVGILHLFDLSLETYRNSHQTCTIGFAVAEGYRRQGIAREAAAHLLRFLFGEGGMRRVRAFAYPDNAPSQALLRSLGFVEVPDRRDEFRHFECGRATA